MPATKPNRWWMRGASNAATALRVICLPHAGAGASAYQSWQPLLPPGWDMIVAQLPGRENRLIESPLESIEEMAAALIDQGESVFRLPFILFGHSMGALIAFELSRRLEQLGAARPERVFVSGRKAPGAPDEEPLLADTSDAALIRQLAEYGGTDATALVDRELMELILPALRADIFAVQSYRWNASMTIRAPIVAYGGRSDPFVSVTHLKEWSRVTSGEFGMRTFAGGHFFLRQQTQEVIAHMHYVTARPGPAMQERT